MSEKHDKPGPPPIQHPEPVLDPLGLGLPGEDVARMLAAEADAAYRWAAAAVAGRHVLAAGCGTGEGCRTLQEAGAQTVLGTDPDPRAIAMATRLYGAEIRFLGAETAALPLASGTFGAVVCVDARTAELDPDAAIAELCRVLADDGVLLVSLPLSVASHDAASNGAGDGVDSLREALASRFANTAVFRRRLTIAASVAPADGAERAELTEPEWLGGDAAEDRAVLLAASDAELPALPSPTSMVSFRDLRAHEETLLAWEQRARRAEADGSAKHWELVAAREAQRRLRMRLYQLEHRPLRILSRVLRGRPARLGQGPPLRASEVKPEHWD